MNKYELGVLYHPDLEVDLEKGERRVKKIIQDNEGKIIATDNWGKKKLAYTINKLDHAVYVFYTVEFKPTNLTKIESTLNITDEVIRYIIVKQDEKELAKIAAAKAVVNNKKTQAKDIKPDDEE